MHETLGDGYITDSGKRIYDDEDPGVRSATQFRHQEANSFQEEIANVIRAEGYTLNDPTETIAQMNQLNTAIDKKVSDEATIRAAADTNLQNDINTNASNLTNHEHGSGGISAIDLTSDSQLSGLLPQNKLTNNYNRSDFIFSGFTSPLTLTCSQVHYTGNWGAAPNLHLIHITCEGGFGTSNSPNFASTNNLLSQYRPKIAAGHYFHVFGRDNGNDVPIMGYIDLNGKIWFSRLPYTPNVFSSGGEKGVHPFNVTMVYYI